MQKKTVDYRNVYSQNYKSIFSKNKNHHGNKDRYKIMIQKPEP